MAWEDHNASDALYPNRCPACGANMHQPDYEPDDTRALILWATYYCWQCGVYWRIEYQPVAHRQVLREDHE